MTAPTIQGTPALSTNANGLNHTVNLPASIQVGELLVAIISGGGNNSSTWTFPAGWTRILGSSSDWFGIAWRIADGSEGASITVTVPANRISCSVTYRLASYEATPSLAVGTTATGSSAAANPPSVAPGWGTVDFLSIAMLNSLSTTDPTSPSGYSTGQHQQDTTNTIEFATAELAFTAASSEDPGTFTNGNNSWRTNTLLIRGASSAARTDQFFVMF